MRKILIHFLLFLIFTTPSFANDISSLERSVIERSNNNPDTAYEYFLEKIEVRANPEEQAVYLYGMGLINETKGNVSGAINDYMAAEILGNERAKHALIRLRKKEKSIYKP